MKILKLKSILTLTVCTYRNITNKDKAPHTSMFYLCVVLKYHSAECLYYDSRQGLQYFVCV